MHKRFALFLLLTTVYIVYYSSWLYAFYPGVMSVDSISHWVQTNNQTYTAGMSVIYSFFIHLLRLVFDSPGAVGFSQIIITSITYSSIISEGFKKGVNRKVLVFSFILSLFWPLICIYNITLWKDVLYSQMILITAFILFKLINNKEELNTKKVVLLSLTISITALVRLNGLVYIIIIPIILVLLRIFPLKKLIFLSLTILFIFLGLYIFTYRVLKVDVENMNYVKSGPKVQMIAAVINGNYELSTEEALVISKIMPIEDFKNRYRCSAWDYLWINESKFNSKIFQDDSFLKEFNKTFYSLARRNLPIMISDRVCLFAHVTGLGSVKDGLLYYNIVEPNDLGISQSPNTLTNIYNRILSVSTRFPFRYIFWNNFLYIIVFSAIFFYSLVKNKKSLFVFTSIVLINVPIIFVIGVSRDLRYLYMVSYSLPILPIIFSLSNKNGLDTTNSKKN